MSDSRSGARLTHADQGGKRRGTAPCEHRDPDGEHPRRQDRREQDNLRDDPNGVVDECVPARASSEERETPEILQDEAGERDREGKKRLLQDTLDQQRHHQAPNPAHRSHEQGDSTRLGGCRAPGLLGRRAEADRQRQ